MDLMNLLPPVYDENTTMRELQSILTGKINTLISNTGAMVDECFLTTASALLSRYEKIHGCTVDVSKSDDFRREILKAKIAGISTVTKQMLIDAMANCSNETVEIIENPSDYSFVVKFTGTLGIPEHMADLTSIIDEIKPAHLAYAYIYTFIANAGVGISLRTGTAMTIHPYTAGSIGAQAALYGTGSVVYSSILTIKEKT